MSEVRDLLIELEQIRAKHSYISEELSSKLNRANELAGAYVKGCKLGMGEFHCIVEKLKIRFADEQLLGGDKE